MSRGDIVSTITHCECRAHTHTTSFPGQEDRAGSTKIPSIIVYDKNGGVRAVGAEAYRPAIKESIEDEGWTRVEWYVE